MPERNTYGLPTGEAIRRELVRVFREQRKAALGAVKAIKSAEVEVKAPPAQDLPDFGGPQRRAIIPEIDWDALFLGNREMALRFVPLLQVIWDRSGRDLLARIGEDPERWDVEDPNLLAAIEDAALAFCEATNETTSLQLDQALEETRNAAYEGGSVEALTTRINEIFDGAERWRARRIATSEAARGYHAAEVRSAQQSGVVAGFRWLMSEDACPLCRTVARRVPAVRIGQPFAVNGDHPDYSVITHPPLHPGCCLPETPVIAPVRVAGIEAQYDGPVVRLVLSDGSDVTITPNHMLLTREGFAKASALAEGDDVIRCVPGDWMSLDIPEDDRKPVPIHEVVKALAVAPGMTTGRVPVAPEYLHGDAESCHREINVVTTDGHLSHHPSLGDAAKHACPFHHQSGEPGFGRGHDAGVGLVETGDFSAVLIALLRATDGGVRSLRESKAALWGRGRHAEPLALAVGAGLDAHSQQPPPDGRARDAERLGECLFRFPGKVATAKVIKVERAHYSGPVYDIETLTSLYLIGHGIVSSNCQCSLEEILLPEYGGPTDVTWGSTLQQPEPEEQDVNAAATYEPEP